jgi:hypothetical protein
MATSRRLLLNRGALFLALCWLFAIGLTLDPAVDDFERYWQAAVDLHRYGNPYVTRADFFYPPFFVYLVQPFGLVSHEQGQWAWFALNSVALGGFVALAIWLSRSLLARRFWGVVALLVVVVPPTRLSLQLGQVSIVVALLVAGCFALARSRAPLAGLLLALASLTRLNPALLGVYYMLRRPRRVAWWSIVMGVALLALSVVFYGTAHYESYFQTIVQRNINREGAYPYAAAHNISLFGFWSRMFTVSHHTIPLADLPTLAHALTLLMSLAVLVLCFVVGRRDADDGRDLLGYGVWVCAMMLLLPTNGYYNLVIMVLPLLAMVRVLEERPDRRLRAWLVVAVALLCIPPGWSHAIPWLYEAVRTGWGVVALTPSLYGLLICTALLALFARRQQQNPQEETHATG